MSDKYRDRVSILIDCGFITKPISKDSLIDDMFSLKQEISKRDELLRNFIREHDAWNKGQSYGACFNYLTEKAKELIGGEK